MASLGRALAPSYRASAPSDMNLALLGTSLAEEESVLLVADLASSLRVLELFVTR